MQREVKNIEANVELKVRASLKLEEREGKRAVQTYIYMTAKLRKTRINCCTEVPYREINLFHEMRYCTAQEENFEKETTLF